MDYLTALDALSGHAHIKRYRWLCSEDNLDAGVRAAWRLQVVAKATHQPAKYPSVGAMVGGVVAAVGGAAAAAVSGGEVWRPAAEQAACLAICEVCEHFDHAQRRCIICGCFANLKARLAREHCPLPEPKW